MSGGADCAAEAESCPTGFQPLQGYQRPKFDLKFLLLATLLAAIWLAGYSWLSRFSLGVLAVMLLTFLFGCRRTRGATAALVPALIAPYAWIFWDASHPWDSYRRLWAGMLFELPGILSAVIWRVAGGSGESAERLCAAITTVLLFLLLVTGARISRNWLVAMVFLTFNLSLLNSFLTHALYAM